jgi:hypothetical protein
MLKELHQPYAVCVMLTALHVSACGWPSGDDVAVSTEPNLTPSPNSSHNRLAPGIPSRSKRRVPV